MATRRARGRHRHGVPGLSRRDNRAYYSRRMPKDVGGDRIYTALEADWGSELAVQRASVINTFWDRGDWAILRRWNAGEVHISALVRAVREGAYQSLRRLNADGVLLGDAVLDHLRRLDATQSEGTYRNHRTVCDALVREFGDDFPMHELTIPAAEAFLHAPRLDGEPWAPNTQRLYRTVAGALWGYAIQREIEEAERRGLEPTLRRNPWRKASVRKARTKRPQVLDLHELEQLVGHPEVYDTPKEALLAIAGFAGLRQQEILNLRLDQDVVIEGSRPMLRVQSREGEHDWETKTERSERDVRIPAVLVEIVRRHIANGYAGARYLFRGSNRPDGPIHPATADRWTQEAFEAAGLLYGRDTGEGLTLHSLRHSHATILLSRGASIATVSERLGDTQKVVLETYSHVLPRDEELALGILDGAPPQLSAMSRIAATFTADPATGNGDSSGPEGGVRLRHRTSPPAKGVAALRCDTSATNADDTSVIGSETAKSEESPQSDDPDLGSRRTSNRPASGASIDSLYITPGGAP